MEGTKYTTKEEVLKRAQEVIGIPLKEVDKTGRLSTGKSIHLTPKQSLIFPRPVLS